MSQHALYKSIVTLIDFKIHLNFINVVCRTLSKSYHILRTVFVFYNKFEFFYNKLMQGWNAGISVISLRTFSLNRTNTPVLFKVQSNFCCWEVQLSYQRLGGLQVCFAIWLCSVYYSYHTVVSYFLHLASSFATSASWPSHEVLDRRYFWNFNK